MGLSLTKLLLTAIACVILPACATNVGGTVDSVPTWLGGMPRDVPPLPGTPEYDAWQKKRAELATIKSK